MLATAITLTTAALLTSQLVHVRSSTNCPAAQDIAERLRALLPDEATTGSAPDLATVDAVAPSEGAPTLRIRLVRANGAEVGDRRVPLAADCSDAAATVAAVIAAWETEPLPAAMLVGTPATVPAAFPAAATPAWRALVGIGGGVGLVGGAAGVGRLEALAGPSTSRWQGRIGFAGETMRTLSLATGTVDWRHTTFEAAVLLRTLHPRWSLSLDAGVVLGWATLEGHGFAPSRRQRSFEYGGLAALRLTRNLGRWSAWVEARGHGWLRRQRASLSDTAVSVSEDLSQVDVCACAGLSVQLL